MNLFSALLDHLLTFNYYLSLSVFGLCVSGLLFWMCLKLSVCVLSNVRSCVSVFLCFECGSMCVCWLRRRCSWGFFRALIMNREKMYNYCYDVKNKRGCMDRRAVSEIFVRLHLLIFKYRIIYWSFVNARFFRSLRCGGSLENQGWKIRTTFRASSSLFYSKCKNIRGDFFQEELSFQR